MSRRNGGGARHRQRVYERDHSVCFKCHCNVDEIETGYRSARSIVQGEHGHRMALIYAGVVPACLGRVSLYAAGIRSAQLLAGELKAIDDRLRFLGFTPGRVFWEVHHRVALAEGGLNVYGNYCTACVPCHKLLSAELEARLAARPSKRLMIIGVDRADKLKVW